MQNQCAEIRIRAERRGGELLKKQTIKGGERHKLHDGTYERKITLPSEISKIQSSRWQSIASIPEDIFEDHISNAKDKKQELTNKSIQLA